jgi:hypothetical protein
MAGYDRERRLGGGAGPPHPSQAAMGTTASGGAGRNGGTTGPPSASASLQISSAERMQRVAAEAAARRCHPRGRQKTAALHTWRMWRHVGCCQPGHIRSLPDSCAPAQQAGGPAPCMHSSSTPPARLVLPLISQFSLHPFGPWASLHRMVLFGHTDCKHKQAVTKIGTTPQSRAEVGLNTLMQALLGLLSRSQTVQLISFNQLIPELYTDSTVMRI